MKASRQGKTINFTGQGLTSRQEVRLEIEQTGQGSGIVFQVVRQGISVEIPALAKYVVNTLRNVVLGKDEVRLCIVEHFLAAASLWGLSNLKVTVDGLEMPLGDGSAAFWIELFKNAGWPKKEVQSSIELPLPLAFLSGDRAVIAVPDQKFSMSYHMDWDHPLIGKRWQSWDACSSVEDIAGARTFGWLKEHQLLGLDKSVVSLTVDGFTQALRFEDEPVRHKLLDLLGDLTLAGVNPMAFKARFISIKGGHELDCRLASKLAELA